MRLDSLPKSLIIGMKITINGDKKKVEIKTNLVYTMLHQTREVLQIHS